MAQSGYETSVLMPHLFFADSVLSEELVSYATIEALLLRAVFVVELYDGLAVEGRACFDTDGCKTAYNAVLLGT